MGKKNLGNEFNETSTSFSWSGAATESSCIILTSVHVPYHVERMRLHSHGQFELPVFEQDTRG
jgi:hypothetical protein